MSGVSVGSRLEQLQTLRRRTVHETAAARRREDHHELERLRVLITRIDEEIVAEGGKPPTVVTAAPAGVPKTRRKKAEDRVTQRVERLGVTSNEIKVWAVSAGLIDTVRRGRIRGELVDAYAAAHQPTTTTGGTP